MNRRERLMATLRGEPVDRPAVSFYQIGGHLVNRNDPDPFNIYNHPTWHPLLQLAEEKTDLIMMYPPQVCRPAVAHDAEFWHTEKYLQAGSKFTRTTLSIAGRTMTSLTRRDPDVETIWTLEHLLKDEDDLRAYLALPEAPTQMPVDIAPLLAAERELGDRGIIMVDTVDPLCLAAELFSLADYTVLAFTQRALFHKLLEKLAQPLYAQTGVLAQKFPGHLWRICGPEYATEPYLPPELFNEYVVRYTGPMVDMIQCYGGFARIHCHGRIRNVLPFFQQMGASAIDPIEPPPQGNITLAEVRSDYGRDFVLFGNLESSDIENLAPSEFEKIVARSLRDGTTGPGRGFVLMPSAAPYGRIITLQTMTNYETIIRLVEAI